MSLIEVMIAMTLLSIVVAAMGAVSVRLAHQSLTVSGGSFVTAEATWHLNRILSLPYDSLTAAAGNVDVAATPYPYRREVTLSVASASSKQVRLVIRPANTLLRPETLVFIRTKTATNPLSSP